DMNSMYAYEKFDTLEESKSLFISGLKDQKSVYPLNFILFGPPGTGKTYQTANYAVSIVKNIDLIQTTNNSERQILMQDYHELIKLGRIGFVTFHQNYGYEDFVQGLRPFR